MDEKKKTKPDFTGQGVAIWKHQTKEGKPYLSVQILGSIYVNCFLLEEKKPKGE